MEKIEKLDMIYGSKISSKLPDRINDMVILSEKVNEIIDYLNIQPQTEEKECCPLFKEYKQDTPEQKEEWEFDLRNLMYRDGEQLRCAGEGKPYTGEYRELVVSMIKNLLSEREEFTKDELFMLKLAMNDIHNKGNGAYDEIGKKIERMLSKLNKKK